MPEVNTPQIMTEVDTIEDDSSQIAIDVETNVETNSHNH